MTESLDGLLAGLRVLVVEDEHLVALALADDLEEAGAQVVGPAFSLESALELTASEPIDAAVLDIKLKSQLVFPVARALTESGVPFLFTTGFDAGILPEEYAHVAKCEKPVRPITVVELLAQFRRRDA